jgi:hypothetical protein
MRLGEEFAKKMISKRRSLKGGVAVLSLALIAVLAFSAVAAASVTTAPRWSVKATYIPAGTTKSFTATNTTEVRLNNASRHLTLTAEPGGCTESGEIEGSAEGTPGIKKNVVLTCKSLRTIINGIDRTTLCPVNSVGAEAGTIKTNTLKSTLVWLNQAPSGAAGDLLAPSSGTNLATIEIKGASCPLNTGATPLNLTNGLIDAILPVEKEAQTGTLAFPETPTLSYWSNAESRSKTTIEQMKLGGTVATFNGNFAITLSPKEPFGVSPVPPEPPEESTPRWKVAGSYLQEGHSEPFTAVNYTPVYLTASSFRINLPECTETGNLVGSKEKTAGSMSEVKITCAGVNVQGVSACEVRTPGQPYGTMISQLLHGALVGFGSGTLEMSSEGSEVWFELESRNCPPLETLPSPIKGSALGDMQTGIESTTLPSFFPEPGNYLRYGSKVVTFEGSFNTTLVSGKSFGIFEG